MTYRVTLPAFATFEAWREAARILASHGVSPGDVIWSRDEGGGDLFGGAPLPAMPGPQPVRVARAFPTLARSVACHRDGEAFALLYAALVEAQGAPPRSSPLGARLHAMERAVRRDIHKMHAFVRFREIGDRQAPRRRFAAWFEPDHHIAEAAAPFFRDRFADMDWAIATPGMTIRCIDGDLTFSCGEARPDLPADATQALWGAYFASIFNPARVKLGAMTSEMPRKYWRNLPETELIPAMVAGASERVRRMQEAAAAAPSASAARILARLRAATSAPSSEPLTLEEARRAALECRRCGLCDHATQTVWGEGPGDARIMVVGEQPGHEEDLAGRPFVGPAGQMLRRAAQEAGLDLDATYRTNTVKHFKFEPRGKRRLHKRASQSEIDICRWWLDRELDLVRPKVTIALGATATSALVGKNASLTEERGRVLAGRHGGPVMATWHPSYLLRLRDAEQAAAAYRELVDDLSNAHLASRN